MLEFVSLRERHVNSDQENASIPLFGTSCYRTARSRSISSASPSPRIERLSRVMGAQSRDQPPWDSTVQAGASTRRLATTWRKSLPSGLTPLFSRLNWSPVLRHACSMITSRLSSVIRQQFQQRFGINELRSAREALTPVAMPVTKPPKLHILIREHPVELPILLQFCSWQGCNSARGSLGLERRLLTFRY